MSHMTTRETQRSKFMKPMKHVLITDFIVTHVILDFGPLSVRCDAGSSFEIRREYCPMDLVANMALIKPAKLTHSSFMMVHLALDFLFLNYLNELNMFISYIGVLSVWCLHCEYNTDLAVCPHSGTLCRPKSMPA